MFDIGFLEMALVGIVGLLVLGPERLPKAARSVGLVVGKVRRTVSGFQHELERQVRAEELKEKMKDPYATFLDDSKSEPAPDNINQVISNITQPSASANPTTSNSSTNAEASSLQASDSQTPNTPDQPSSERETPKS